MSVFAELFKDWVGILSLLVILFILVMGGYFAWLFVAKSSEPPGGSSAGSGAS